MTDSLAPIVLFVYNRPWHTSQTLHALMQNKLAGQSTLYVYCDGAKQNASEASLKDIQAVRDIVRDKQWCNEVIIVEAEQNKGLAASIRNGVTEVINKYGQVIVMEDDLITSPAFLTYMNKALSHYENRKSVFSISGYNLPASIMQIPPDYDYDVYVSLRNGSWGWASWQDRWNHIDWNVKHYPTMVSNTNMQESFNRGGDDVFEML